MIIVIADVIIILFLLLLMAFHLPAESWLISAVSWIPSSQILPWIDWNSTISIQSVDCVVIQRRYWPPRLVGFSLLSISPSPFPFHIIRYLLFIIEIFWAFSSFECGAAGGPPITELLPPTWLGRQLPSLIYSYRFSLCIFRGKFTELSSISPPPPPNLFIWSLSLPWNLPVYPRITRESLKNL